MTIEGEEEHEGEVLELEEGQIVPEGEGNEAEGETSGDDEEIVVLIGEEAAPASGEQAPEWVRDLRKRTRELERENAELRRKAAPVVPEVGDKPSLESCEWDEERLETELLAWHQRKSTAERVANEAKASETKAQEAWQAELGTYVDQSKGLGVKDFSEAEDEVVSVLSPNQQAIIISGAESKALMVYALGKNPEKLRELAKITDPVKFAFSVARLEQQTKMERRKAATSPEGQVRGSAAMTGTSDKALERLEAEAERTGDRTKVIAHKRKLRAAGR